jgi:hypothetical protein
MKKELAVVLLSVVSAVASAAPATTVTFSKGTEGWTGVGDGQGGSWIDTAGGRKDNATYHTQIAETFGLNWVTRTNQAFVGNYGAARSVTLEIDVKVNSIVFEGIEVPRHMVVELRDYTNPYGNMPFTSVWFDLGEISSASPGWQHMSVTIPDTRATTLPKGWGGYGSGEVSLPPGRTFADVLANVQEAVFTTFVPGYFYGYTNYDVEVDNIAIKKHERK